MIRETGVREIHRAKWGLHRLESPIQDLRYASRSLARVPGFTAAAVLTLAIGIGANTAIFSIVDEALFRPLDFPRSDELADVFTFNKATQKFLSSSYPDYQDLRARVSSFQALSAFVRMALAVSWKGGTERLPVEAVTGNFFSMLALKPTAGRGFLDSDDSPGSAPVAMISEAVGDASSVGRLIKVEDQPFMVIGIVPKSYHGTNLNWGNPPQVWIPLQTIGRVQPRFREIGIFQQRSDRWLLVTGRLRSGVGLTQAQAEVRTAAEGLAREAPAENRDISELVFAASRAKFWPAYRTSITRSLMAFACASGLVLLLTCANLSNLLLSRGLARQREFAIRVAMGAGRSRLMRQLLTENLLLALPSCALAVGIAYGMGRVIAHFPNAFGLTLALDGGVDGRVLSFCIALSIASAALFGLAPALQAARPDVAPALKESGATATGKGQDWLRNVLMALQMGFAMALLVGAGLCARSVLGTWSSDPGFRLQGLLTMGFSDAPPGAGSGARMQWAQGDLVRFLRASRGIDSATLASTLPMDPAHFTTRIHAGDVALTADYETVGADFFRTLGITLLSGRSFSALDNAGAPRVAVVNAAAAARLWPGENPIGQTVTVGKSLRKVVGVARDAKYGSVWENAQPTLYAAQAQSDQPADYLILHVHGSPEGGVASMVAKEWERRFPRSPLYDFRTGDELLNLALAPQRVATGVFAAFGLIALFLAAVGLYSLMAFAVARRTREIGIRLAVGGAPAAVARHVLGRSMAVAAMGIGMGAVLSAPLAGVFAKQMKGFAAHDSATVAGVALLLLAVVLFAALIPLRRIVRTDPQKVLRSE